MKKRNDKEARNAESTKGPVKLDGPLVGASLRLYRTAKGLTRREVAERSGYSEIYLRKIEEGTRVPTPEALDALCKTIGVSARDIEKIARPENKYQRRLRKVISDLDNLLEGMGATSLRQAILGTPKEEG